MAMLKTITPKSVAGIGALQDMRSYLEGRDRTAAALAGACDYLAHGRGRTRTEASRSIAHADSPNLCVWADTTWADAMMATKVAHGKVGGVPYYHFVISPDPDDRIGAEECLEVAVEWVSRCHPGSEWHVDVHDDNARRIPHAHVVMNSVLPESGRMVHRSRADIAREARTLQAICLERGLSVLPDLAEKAGWERTVGERADRARASTAVHGVEDAMRREGRTSWRALIRERVDESAAHSSSWDDFVAALAARGITVVERRRGITFRLEDFRGGGPRSIKGSTLGQAYTRSGVLHRLYVDWDAITGVTVDSFGRPAEGPRKAHYHPRDHSKDAAALERRRSPGATRRSYAQVLAERIGRNDRWTRDTRRLKRLVEAVRTIDEEGLSSRSELHAEVSGLVEQIESLESSVASYVAATDRAIEVAERGRRIQEDEAWINAMRGRRLWRPSERREVRKRERRIADDRTWCEEQLSTARSWITVSGHDGSDLHSCGIDLAGELRTVREGLESDLIRLRERHEALSSAEKAISALYTQGRARAKGIRQFGAVREGRDARVDRKLRGMVPDGRTRARLDASRVDVRIRGLAVIGVRMRMSGIGMQRAEEELRRSAALRQAKGRQFSEGVFRPSEEIGRSLNAAWQVTNGQHHRPPGRDDEPQQQ